MILKNENDIYMYYEAIEQLEPRSILDVGMFLKRIGSVSRKVMGRGVPEDVLLEGVDFFSEISLPVWNQIYDHVTEAPAFLEEKREKTYDLAFLLGAEALDRKADAVLVAKQTMASATYVLTDRVGKPLKDLQKELRIIDLNLEGRPYFLLDTR